ncbi:hypothetical protein C0995_000117 [Termitomyces sp. Mi166|nr:hypothetical protein C0995_000117 [Termitomyces sp. Mi166\
MPYALYSNLNEADLFGLPDAKAWASRRFPGIDIYDESIIPYIIDRHNRSIGSKNLSENDPTAASGHFDEFDEDADVKLFKKQVFKRGEFYEKAEFVTIIDPYNKGYRSSRVRSPELYSS